MERSFSIFKKVQLFVKHNILVVFLVAYLLSSLTCIKGFWGADSLVGLVYRSIIAVAIVLCSIVLIPLIGKKNIIYFSALLLTGVIFAVVSIFSGILTLDSPFDVKIFISLDNLFRNILAVTLLIPIFYCFKSRSKKNVLIFLIGVFSLSLLSSIYGLIFDCGDFLNVLMNSEGHNFDFDSFYLTKNYFGLVISFGIVSLLIIPNFLSNRKSTIAFKILSAIMCVFLFCILLVTRAKTCIILISLYMLIYLFNLAKRYHKLIIYFCVIMFLVLSFFIWFFIPALHDSFDFSKKIFHFIEYTLLHDAFTVLQSRLKNWWSFISFFSWKLLPGVGDRSFIYLIKQNLHLNSLDNAYLTYFGQGGLFKIVLFGTTIYLIIKNIKDNKHNIFLTVVLLSIILGFGLFLDFSLNSLSFESYAFVGLLATSGISIIQK